MNINSKIKEAILSLDIDENGFYDRDKLELIIIQIKSLFQNKRRNYAKRY